MQSVDPVDSKFIWVRRGISVEQDKECGYLTVMTPPTANLLVMQVSCEALHRIGLNLMFHNIEMLLTSHGWRRRCSLSPWLQELSQSCPMNGGHLDITLKLAPTHLPPSLMVKSQTPPCLHLADMQHW